VVEPAQIVTGPAGLIVTVGNGSTNTVIVAVPIPQTPPVPVTVYVVVAVGEAVGFDGGPLNDPEGDHE